MHVPYIQLSKLLWHNSKNCWHHHIKPRHFPEEVVTDHKDDLPVSGINRLHFEMLSFSPLEIKLQGDPELLQKSIELLHVFKLIFTLFMG